MEAQLENLDEKSLEFKARVFKVLGDANRLKVLEFLRDGERCQCEIIPILDQAQPTVSRHLRLLENVGLITSRRDGNKMMYQASDDRVYNVLDVINDELLRILSHGVLSRYMPL